MTYGLRVAVVIALWAYMLLMLASMIGFGLSWLAVLLLAVAALSASLARRVRTKP